MLKRRTPNGLQWKRKEAKRMAGQASMLRTQPMVCRPRISRKYIWENKKAYDALAQEYAERIDDYANSGVKISQEFINEMKNKGSRRVLELGCGGGINLRYFEGEGFKTTAIEISGKMIRAAKKAAPKTRYILADFLAHNFRGEKFDGIFAHSFIHLFTKRDAEIVLGKTINLLAKGGILYVGTTKHQKPFEGYLEKADYKNSQVKRYRKQWTKKELLGLFKKFGLSVIFEREFEEQARKKSWIYFLLKKD